MSKDARGAIDDYDQALRIAPNSALTYSNRAIVYMDTVNYPQALADLNEAIRLDPKSASALNNRAFLKHLMGNDRAAIDDLDTAISIDSRVAAAYTSRGDTRYTMGDRTAAIADYDRALEIDPRFPDALQHKVDAIKLSPPKVLNTKVDKTPIQVFSLRFVSVKYGHARGRVHSSAREFRLSWSRATPAVMLIPATISLQEHAHV